MPVGREISGRMRPCKAKDDRVGADSTRCYGGPQVSLIADIARRIFHLESRLAKHDSQCMRDTPEADPRFNEFIILQAQNAGLFLGQIPNPHSGEKQVNLRAAKSVMDSLEMLASKTRGNLTPSESKLLHTALENLRPLYHAARSGD